MSSYSGVSLKLAGFGRITKDAAGKVIGRASANNSTDGGDE